MLVEEGLLQQEEVDAVVWSEDPIRVDYGCLYNNRSKLLRLAYDRFEADAQFHAFLRDNQDWLEDYGLFMALKESHRGAPWQQWSLSIMMRMPGVLETFRQELADAIRFQAFQQYLFFRQWKALRAYANGKGIRIIGDVPIYVPYDSVDVWKDTALFQLDEDLNPVSVAGCPPDAFSEDGQLWGNPLYCWDKMKKDGFQWWIRRLAAAGELYDIVRMDHFRGLEAYWSIPYGDATARGGKWIKGPGMAFVEAVKKKLPAEKHRNPPRRQWRKPYRLPFLRMETPMM
jgi:4-alpha-glucanotransferase